jgi:hypothetical protein
LGIFYIYSVLKKRFELVKPPRFFISLFKILLNPSYPCHPCAKFSSTTACTFLIFFLLTFKATSQSDDYTKPKEVNYITQKYLNQADRKIVKLHKQISKKNNKTLYKFSQQEEKILYKYCEKNPTHADILFEYSGYSFNRINKILIKTKGKPSEYFPQLDTISSSLHLAEKDHSLLDPEANKIKIEKKLNTALLHLNQLNIPLEKYEAISQHTRSRKSVLNELAKENPLLKKDVTNLNKEAYYYQQQIAEYKSLFKDRAKAENTAMAWLRKTPVFNNFIKKYGQLAMFNSQVPRATPAIPLDIEASSTELSTSLEMSGSNLNLTEISAPTIADISSASMSAMPMDTEVTSTELSTSLEVPNSNLNLENLTPTLASTKKLISDRISELAQTGEGLSAKKAEETKNLFKKLKASPIKSGTLADAPDFKPNPLKTKRFIDRVTYGGNLQFIPSTYIYPLGCGLGAQVAYQLHVKSSAGLGASYTAGFGKDIGHLKYSHSGYGVRSFIDYQLKKILYLQGGAERNFLPQTKALLGETIFTNQLTPVNAALLGLKIKANSTKQSSQTLEISYNFLHTERSPAMVVRAGWEFGGKNKVKN